MDTLPDVLYCQVLPLAGRRLLVPHGAVIEIVPMSMADNLASPPSTILWRETALPVLCFEALDAEDRPPISPRTRVAVLRVPGGAEMTHVGILIQGYPQMVPVTPDQVRALPLTAQDRRAPVLFRVHFARSEMLIPDLEWLARLTQPETPFSDHVAPSGLQDGDGREGGSFGAQDTGAEPKSLEAVFAGDDLLACVEPTFRADEERH